VSRYIIRYRPCGEALANALIVEDEQQVAYLFSGGQLQGWLAGSDASERLVRALGSQGRWMAVPRVAGYTLEGLCRLTGAPDHTAVGPGSTSREVGLDGEPVAAHLLRSQQQRPGAGGGARRGTP
jgi:hypothetical protein